MIPDRLKRGEVIGVVAPSGPLIGDNKEEIEKAKKILEKEGFRVKFSNHLFSNTWEYSASIIEKVQDIHEMFLNPEVKMIWCAKGGENSNTLFEFLDYGLIQKNPKIFCGYSDITSLANMIYTNTGLVTFSGTNFKTIATDQTDWSYQEILNRLVEANLKITEMKDGYQTIQEGEAQGVLVGGNLSLVRGMAAGKYQMNFQDKILFLEELGMETGPALASNYIAFLKQNGVFDQIKGLWIGNYEHESGISLEKIVLDILGNKISFPIIKSNHFGHLETKIVIPIGTKAKIDTKEERKIEFIEKCVR